MGDRDVQSSPDFNLHSMYVNFNYRMHLLELGIIKFSQARFAPSAFVDLILNAEPYFNEPGRGKRSTDPAANEASRAYNEFVVASLAKSIVELLERPPPNFHDEIIQHFERNIEGFVQSIKTPISSSKPQNVLLNTTGMSSAFGSGHPLTVNP